MMNIVPSWVVAILSVLAAFRWYIILMNTKDWTHMSTMLVRLWGVVLYGFLGTDVMQYPEMVRWSFLVRMWIVAFLIDENVHWILPCVKFILIPAVRERLSRSAEHGNSEH